MMAWWTQWTGQIAAWLLQQSHSPLALLLNPPDPINIQARKYVRAWMSPERAHHAGEWKRSRVLAQLRQLFPDAATPILSVAIELAYVTIKEQSDA